MGIIVSSIEPLRYDNVIYPASGSEQAILSAVAVQPVAFYFTVINSWFAYSGGVYYDSACGTSTNHAMTLIGYDSSVATSRYWIVQNRWGGHLFSNCSVGALSWLTCVVLQY